MTDRDRVRQGLAALKGGDWDGAHDQAQAGTSPLCAWLHAHLHRVEGDPGNAAYWYRKAGRDPFDGTEAEERAAIAAAADVP